jgi:hypothetical protein
LKIHIAAKGTYFEYYGRALAHEFGLLGHEVILATRDTWELDRVEADMHVIVSPNVYTLEDMQALPGYKVAILTEQVPHIGFAENEETLKRFKVFERFAPVFNKFVEWSAANAEYMMRESGRHLGSDGFIVFPHGYIERKIQFPMWDTKWDVCFVGDVSRSPRRQAILSMLRRNEVTVCPYHEDVWRSRKDQIFRQSRLVLNLHFSEDIASFEAHRLCDIAPLCRPIVSELMNEPPDTTSNFVLQTNADCMPDMIRWLLNDGRGKNTDYHLAKYYGQGLRHHLKTRFPISKLAAQICECLN